LNPESGKQELSVLLYKYDINPSLPDIYFNQKNFRDILYKRINLCYNNNRQCLSHGLGIPGFVKNISPAFG